MRWFRRLFRRPPARPDIPKYTQAPVEIGPAAPRPNVMTPYIHKPDPGIEVQEVDTRDMTATGVHRAYDRLKRGEPV